MDHAVAVADLRKAYGSSVAVDRISFDVAEGEILGILGPNGSGKTTTVECLQGLRRRDGGTVSVFGFDPAVHRTQVRRLVGSQLQQSALPDRIRVGEALRLFSAISAGGPPWQRLADDWGLAEHLDAAFGDLSGGQQQRLFVALALIADPRLVVLDEMTTGLDPAARRTAWDLVAAVRDRGATVILVTHVLEEVERLCDRVVLLVGGRVAFQGSVEGLRQSHTGPVAVRFTVPATTGLAFLADIPGVVERDVQLHDDRAHVVLRGRGPLLARAGHALVSHGLEPEDLRRDVPTLEDAYLRLTGSRPAGSGSGG